MKKTITKSSNAIGHLISPHFCFSKKQTVVSSCPSSTVVSSSRSSSYHVFLSFRGRDTRNTFVDHLYTYLVLQGIHTYRDDKTLQKGASIHPSLMMAIEESQIAVVIFSENYGDSTYCMRELAHIMECKDKGGLIVIPIFYNVFPTDVRHQTGKFGDGFAKQYRKNPGHVESWRKVLAAAGKISGWEPKDMASGREAAAINEIINTIIPTLRLTPIANEIPVGIDARMEDFKSCLNVGEHGVRMVGIWGFGGSGKTSLASYVYRDLCNKFDSCCFVGNIRETSDKYGLKKVQEKVLSDVLKRQVAAWSVEEGRLLLRNWLCHKKVLIVLDDVACHEHLHALAGARDWFGDGSLIIITTTDKHLLNAHNVDATYDITLLDDQEAIQLFFRHTSISKEDINVELYIVLERVVSYANGLPLVLKGLALFLCDIDTCEWSSTLDRLKYISVGDFVEKLKLSYDRLSSMDQELFLDIACFFRHHKKDEAMMILDACGFHPVVGVHVLLQKALISIKDGKFDMHAVVQAMGNYIVRGKHTNNPEKHSRVWRYEDIENMCARGATMENNKTQVLFLYPDCHAPPNLLHVVAMCKKLRYINVRQTVKHAEEPQFLSNGLRWISWEGYPAKSLPDSFEPTKLVGLKLQNGLQENLWTGCKVLPFLKELDLRGSNNLITTPDLTGLTVLERLVLSGCLGLKEIHPSVGYLEKLVYLDLDGCKKLQEFPPLIRIQKLDTLLLSGCSNLANAPWIQPPMVVPRHIDICRSGIQELPLSYFPKNVDGELPSRQRRSILVGGGDTINQLK